MPYAKPQSSYRPRELRRRVIMPARLHSSSGWTDACILNVSSRGLMIHSARAGPQGSIVELRRGPHAIVACVVWRDGARVGLKTEERLAVEDLISLNCASAMMVTAGQAQKRARGTPSQRPRAQPALSRPGHRICRSRAHCVHACGDGFRRLRAGTGHADGADRDGAFRMRFSSTRLPDMRQAPRCRRSARHR